MSSIVNTRHKLNLSSTLRRDFNVQFSYTATLKKFVSFSDGTLKNSALFLIFTVMIIISPILQINSKLTAGQYSDQGHTVNISDGATVLVYVILGVFFAVLSF